MKTREELHSDLIDAVEPLDLAGPEDKMLSRQAIATVYEGIEAAVRAIAVAEGRV